MLQPLATSSITCQTAPVLIGSSESNGPITEETYKTSSIGEHQVKIDAEKCAELRKLIAEDVAEYSPGYDSDIRLQRWLTMYKGKMEEIVPKLRLHLVHRKLLNLDDPELPEKLVRSEYPEAKKVHGHVRCIQLQHQAVDRRGHPTHCAKVFTSMAEIHEQASFREQVYLQLYSQELMSRTIESHRATDKDVLSCCTVVQDLEHFKVSSISTLLDDTRLFSEVSANYPFVLGKLIFVNTPKLLDIMGSIASRIFNYELSTVFLGRDFRDTLKQHIDEQHLPEAYGGSRNDYFMHYDDHKNWKKPEKPHKSVEEPASRKAFHIKPKKELTFKVHVQQPNSRIYWWFRASGDIEFTIFRESSMELKDMLVPRFNISTAHLPDTGSCLCEDAGLYTVYFRNSSSLFLSTKLTVSLELEEQPIISEITSSLSSDMTSLTHNNDEAAAPYKRSILS